MTFFSMIVRIGPSTTRVTIPLSSIIDIRPSGEDTSVVVVHPGDPKAETFEVAERYEKLLSRLPDVR